MSLQGLSDTGHETTRKSLRIVLPDLTKEVPASNSRPLPSEPHTRTHASSVSEKRSRSA